MKPTTLRRQVRRDVTPKGCRWASASRRAQEGLYAAETALHNHGVGRQHPSPFRARQGNHRRRHAAWLPCGSTHHAEYWLVVWRCRRGRRRRCRGSQPEAPRAPSNVRSTNRLFVVVDGRGAETIREVTRLYRVIFLFEAAAVIRQQPADVAVPRRSRSCRRSGPGQAARRAIQATGGPEEGRWSCRVGKTLRRHR